MKNNQRISGRTILGRRSIHVLLPVFPGRETHDVVEITGEVGVIIKTAVERNGGNRVIGRCEAHAGGANTHVHDVLQRGYLENLLESTLELADGKMDETGQLRDFK